MKSLQVTAPGDVMLVEAPVPEPGPGEALLRVEAVTTCPQWDLHLRHNDPMFAGHRFHYPYPPGQPGHEATGVVEAVGEGVTEVSPGDRVSAWRDPGHHVPGCYAQYAVRKVEDLIRVPADLPFEATAPLELAMCMGCVFLMLKEMDVIEGRSYGITGLGPAGLVALQMALAEGARGVYGFDPSPARRDFALSLGASAAFDPSEELRDRFPVRPKPSALDCAVDCVGARASVQFLMDRTADVVALFGVQREDYTYSPRHYPGLRLCGYRGHHRAAAEYAVSLLESGKLNLAPLSTHHLPLERYSEGIDLLERQEAIKVCFWPWRQA